MKDPPHESPAHHRLCRSRHPYFAGLRRRPAQIRLGMPAFVAALGPVHGLAFIVFLVVTMYALGEGLITRWGALRFFIGSLIPFGGFINERWLARQATETH